ncbi:MAG: DEAD/DEAH box helicase [Saprospiraceae bacterium]|nr:DEAD/DEAH box helicase [Saprospiraceae bacterium]
MRFDTYPLAPILKENISLLGWRRPTDIQYKAIPSVLRGEDVLAIAQTGTGKTAAFAIPAIQHILNLQGKDRYQSATRCLIMVPTHELALQISDVLSTLSRKTKVSILAIFGGVGQDEQIDGLRKGAEIVVATPGRLFDLRSQGHLDLTSVDFLVLDEADHMLDLGFITDIRDLMRFLPQKRQTLFFSATIDKKIKKLAYSLVKNPIRIQISPKNPVSKNVHHTVAFVEMDDKRFFLERLIRENPDQKILVFVRTRVRAERVQKAMARVDISCQFLHGDVVQRERSAVLESFRSGEVKILVATDVSARGIHIPDVQYVVNYDLPDQIENYVHRVGRTGRGKHRGFAISFCSDQERDLLQKIETFIKGEIEIFPIKPGEQEITRDLSTDFRFDMDALLKDVERTEKKQRGKWKGK